MTKKNAHIRILASEKLQNLNLGVHCGVCVSSGFTRMCTFTTVFPQERQVVTYMSVDSFLEKAALLRWAPVNCAMLL